MLQLRISARNGIADDHQVRNRRKVLFRIGLANRDAERAQEVRHRRVRGVVRPGDLEAALPKHPRQRGHGGAANADEMEVTGRAHVADFTPAFAGGAAVAASRLLSCTSSLFALSDAVTPIGRVTLAPETCPERNPNATGIPRSPTTRRTTSSRVYCCSGCCTQFSISPKMIACTPENFPASLSCMSMRSI